MSYLARHPFRRSFPAPLFILMGLLAVGCADSDGLASPPVTAAQTPNAALLSVDEFDEYLSANPSAPLINVHIPYEGHIAETDAFISFDSILDDPDLPSDRAAPIALYCRSGNMSAQAATDLREAGYTNVVDLDGGMNAWTADGRELLDDPTAGQT